MSDACAYRKDLVAVVEELLEKARSGELTALAIATCHADLSTGNVWMSVDASFAELLGSVELLKHELLVNGLDP